MSNAPQTHAGPPEISPSAIDLPPTQPLDLTAWLAAGNDNELTTDSSSSPTTH